jgi:hypothetical protein
VLSCSPLPGFAFNLLFTVRDTITGALVSAHSMLLG